VDDKAYHAIELHFVSDFLSVIRARVVNLPDQFDRMFSPGQILRMLFHDQTTES
jgi:hypothetical protein